MFNFYIYFGIPILVLVGAAGGGSLVFYFIKHPEVVDKWLRGIRQKLKALKSRIYAVSELR